MTYPAPKTARAKRRAKRESGRQAKALRVATCASVAVFALATAWKGVGFAQAQTVTDSGKPRPAGASVSATRTTVDALSSAITASFLGGLPLFRVQLGSSGWELDRGSAASSGDSPWSLWATPVYSSINNRIEPLLSEGSVSLLIAGIEYAVDDTTVTGIAYTRDSLRIDATERVAGAADRLSRVSGRGWTIAPYLAHQINAEWLFDVSAGFGVNELKSTQLSDLSVATPKDDRSFAAVGFTYLKPVSKGLLLTGKIGFSVTRDKIDDFPSTPTSGSVLSLPGSEARLKQFRLGGQLSYQMGSFSPFVGAYGLLNDFSVATTGLVTPREYGEVAQFVAGVNASSGPVYGAFTLLHERDRSQARVYFGFRY